MIESFAVGVDGLLQPPRETARQTVHVVLLLYVFLALGHSHLEACYVLLNAGTALAGMLFQPCLRPSNDGLMKQQVCNVGRLVACILPSERAKAVLLQSSWYVFTMCPVDPW